MKPLGSPAAPAGFSLERIARGGNPPPLRGGEEVEVLGGPRRELLHEQYRSPCQQEALAGGQREEHQGHLLLEGRQIRLAADGDHYASALPDAETSSAHADRTARGRTRSSHKSTSSAPST